jgi:hypothetical protein
MPNSKLSHGSEFRTWLQSKWYEHLDELDAYGLGKPKYDLQHYFNKYKYWLKREFKFQKGQ